MNNTPKWSKYINNNSNFSNKEYFSNINKSIIRVIKVILETNCSNKMFLPAKINLIIKLMINNS